MFIGIAGFLCLHGLAHFFIRYQTINGHWYEAAMSKRILGQNVSSLDYIFIGSSTTQNNINTELLNRNGLKAFNLGVPGISWHEYIESIHWASQHSQKYVVLNISPKLLFMPLKCPSIRYMSEFIFFTKHFQLNCLNEFKLSGIFSLNEIIPVFNYGKNNTETINDLAENYSYSDFTQRKLNYIRGDAKRFVVTFSNGDGQVFSKQSVDEIKLNQNEVFKQLSHDFDPSALQFIRAINEIIMKKNKKLILNIERGPYPETIEISAEKLKAQLPSISIFFHHDLNMPTEFWADLNHFSLKGSNYYTEILMKKLKSI